jgi:hypothetical protein
MSMPAEVWKFHRARTAKRRAGCGALTNGNKEFDDVDDHSPQAGSDKLWLGFPVTENLAPALPRSAVDHRVDEALRRGSGRDLILQRHYGGDHRIEDRNRAFSHALVRPSESRDRGVS